MSCPYSIVKAKAGRDVARLVMEYMRPAFVVELLAPRKRPLVRTQLLAEHEERAKCCFIWWLPPGGKRLCFRKTHPAVFGMLRWTYEQSRQVERHMAWSDATVRVLADAHHRRVLRLQYPAEKAYPLWTEADVEQQVADRAQSNMREEVPRGLLSGREAAEMDHHCQVKPWLEYERWRQGARIAVLIAWHHNRTGTVPDALAARLEQLSVMPMKQWFWANKVQGKRRPLLGVHWRPAPTRAEQAPRPALCLTGWGSWLQRRRVDGRSLISGQLMWQLCCRYRRERLQRRLAAARKAGREPPKPCPGEDAQMFARVQDAWQSQGG